MVMQQTSVTRAGLAGTLAIASTLLFSGAAQAAVLFSNGPVVDGSGLSILVPPQGTLGVGANPSATVAEDFAIGSGESWDISSLDFFGYQTGSTGFTFTSVTWRIVSGLDVNTGATLASGTTSVTNGGLVGYRVTDTTLTNTQRPIFQINADIPDITLGAGNYFVTWALAGTSTSGPFVPPVFGSLGSGNALQAIGPGSFALLQDGGSLQSMALPFAINGTLTTSAVPEPTTWAMMIAGFGLVGAGMRRRGTISRAVTFAA